MRLRLLLLLPLLLAPWSLQAQGFYGLDLALGDADPQETGYGSGTSLDLAAVWGTHLRRVRLTGELGYLAFGKMTGPAIDQVITSADATAYTLRGTAAFPLRPRVNLGVKLGVLFWSLDRVDAQAGVAVKRRRSGRHLYWGLFLGYVWLPGLEVQGRLERAAVDNFDMQTLGLAAVFHF